MSQPAATFGLACPRWPGISKLVEEAGEVGQVCGKLITIGGAVLHWDGTNLRDRLTDEIADVLAAATFVIERCKLDAGRIALRKREKLALYYRWSRGEDPPPPQPPDPPERSGSGVRGLCARCGGTGWVGLEPCQVCR